MRRELSAHAPGGREVIVRAVRRGDLLRDLDNGSGELLGLLLEVAVKAVAAGASRLRKGWTVGIVSVDAGPWAGQKVLHRESLTAADPQPRIEELKRLVESGQWELPHAQGRRTRRKPPNV